MSSGDLDVNTAMHILGSGLVVIDAGGESGIHDRVFDTSTSGPIVFENLTITGGLSPNNEGWIASGGGIRNTTNLTLIGITLQNNKAGDGLSFCVSGGHGGGIASNGTLDIEQSIIAHNWAGDGPPWSSLPGSFYSGSGGGIYSGGSSLTLVDSDVYDNHAGDSSMLIHMVVILMLVDGEVVSTEAVRLQ